MTPKPLPNPLLLQEAVSEVIRQNKRIGYVPTRFIGEPQEGYASNLVQVCTKLIHSDSAVEALQAAIFRYPGLLTLEDLVAESNHGRDWGFDEESVERARATVQLLDDSAKCQRWQ